MAKKAQQGRLILFEPNPDDNQIIPNEDLSILVELETTRKGRSVISVDRLNETSRLNNSDRNRTTKVKFIEGSDYAGGKSLTTSYLDATTVFNANGEEDFESLGIESIDISFDTAYTPIIKIKFIDIRGRAIFEQGIHSKYKSFFELPYPLFSLTVKGFYGKPVKYCLHLTKWNSSFNSQTGNFEIEADFIGYTYAMLTDVSLGLMRAVVSTEEGKPIFEEYKKEYANSGRVLKTIDEMLEDIQKLGDEFEKIKNEDVELKELNSSAEVTEVIDLIEGKLIELTNTIVNGKDQYFNNRDGIIGTGKNKSESAEVIKAISDYKEKVTRDLDGDEVGLNLKIKKDTLKLRTEDLTKIIEIRGLLGKDLVDAETATSKVFSGGTGTNIVKVNNGEYSYDDETNPKSTRYLYVNSLMKTVIANLPGNFPTQNSESEVVIYDARTAFVEIERVTEQINENNKEIRERVGEKLRKSAKENLDFDPTIKNIFSVLTAHCEIFLKTLSEVSKSAERSIQRKKIFDKVLTRNGEVNVKNGSTIFPWPEYRENKAKKSKDKTKDPVNSFEETWIGSALNGGEALDVPEVVFVEHLIRELMNLAKNDDSLISATQGAVGPQYYPVSPLDVTVGNVNQISRSPYAAALVGENTKGTPDEITRCLLMRGFLGLGVANVRLDDANVSTMGALEAENLYSVLTTFDRPVARQLFNALKTYGGGNAKTAKDEILKKWVDGVGDTVIHPGGQTNRSLMTLTSGNYTYDYIRPLTVSGVTTDQRTYIPVSGNFDGSDFYNDDNTLKTNEELRLISDASLFVGNNIGNIANAGYTDGQANFNDDGSTYLRIFTLNDYTGGGMFPTYGSDIVDKYRKSIPEGTLISQNSLPGAVYDNAFIQSINTQDGLYKTLEISNLIYNGLGGDADTDKIHYKQAGSPEGVSSVLCAYWNQDPYSNTSQKGGSYLSRGWEGDYNSFKTTISATGGTYEPQRFNRNNSRKYPKDFGKQREIIGDLLEDVENPKPNDVYIPYIEYGIANSEDYTNYHFSLFGSKFYYEQTDEAKAYLFLHSLPWQGIIGDVGDMVSSTDSRDVSLFDIIEFDGSSFKGEDDTYTIKSLYTRNGSFIQAPRLWCAFLGSILHRYDQGNITGNDIINWDVNIPWKDSASYIPTTEQYLNDTRAVSMFGINLVFDAGDVDRDDEPAEQSYALIDRALKGLPQQVRNEFKQVYFNFINNEFQEVKREFELVTNYNSSSYNQLWNDLDGAITANTTTRTTSGSVKYQGGGQTVSYTEYKIKSLTVQDLFPANVIKNYGNVSPCNNSKWQNNGGDVYQFNLQIRPDSYGNTLLGRLIKETYVIQNIAPRSFFNIVNDPIGLPYNPISVSQANMDLYVESFFTRFNQLAENWSTDQDTADGEIQSRIFNTIDDDTIKLNMYRILSSIYNKWIAGSDDIFTNCGRSSYDNQVAVNDRGQSAQTKLIDSFRFLDRAFNNIGDDFFLNPLALSNMIVGNYNQSFFDVVNKTLIDNNFNFIALPTFLNFNDVSQMEDAFRPYTFNDVVSGDYASGPSFVCVYVGDTSSNLDLGEDSDYPDDGIVIKTDANGNIINAPEDFTNSNPNDGSLNVPFFLVSYGQQNQSYFKDVKLDQREFTETAESLQIIEDISQSGDKRKPNFNGQNLFNVYQTRSYSAEVEMMGNAMIQPMMYFQLNNIPMFRGAYLIIKVTHKITPHNMTTTFKGVRVKRTKTPLIDAATLFMSLLGSLEALGESRTIGGGTSTSNLIINTETIQNSGGLFIEEQGGVYVVNRQEGIAGATLKEFMADLNTFLASSFAGRPDNEAYRLFSNGITRELRETVAGGPGRSKKSKHGAGLAIDFVFTGKFNNTILGNPYDNSDNRKLKYGWRAGNAVVAKDHEFMSKIREFIDTDTKWSPLIKWGADFTTGGKQGFETVQNGNTSFKVQIDELHHFEIKDGQIAPFFKKYEPQLRELGLEAPTDSNGLAKLYAKPFEFEQDNKIAGQEIKGDDTQGDGVDTNTNINT